MGNKISIDELFREKLTGGREAVNLGAWANMERMLDGKNPYRDGEEKRRRFLPILWWVLLLGGLGSAGLYTYRQQTSALQASSQGASKMASYDPSVTSSSDATTPTSQAAVQISSTEIGSSENKQPGSPSTKYPEKQHRSSGSPVVSSTSTGRPDKRQLTSSQLSTSQPGGNTAIVLTHESDKQDHTAVSPKSFAGSAGTKPSAIQLAAHTNTNMQPIAVQAAPDKSAVPALQKVIEKIPAVTISQHTIQSQDGQTKLVRDTLAHSIVETEVSRKQEIPTASVDPVRTNPRFKALTAEEEQHVSDRVSDPQGSYTREQVAQASVTQTETHHVFTQTQQRTTKTAKSSYLEDLRKFGVDMYRKINNYFLFHPKPDLYNGMLLGVNASMSNSKHNFGGFHGGWTTLKPLNDYFSFLTEFKFYYRNNGGYTANDISCRILNQNADTMSLSHIQQTIYSYQKDSLIKTYNFRNFYSLELPLMLQFNYRSLAVYGGLNLAYSFRLNTSEKSRNYVSTVIDTMPASMAYSFPVDKLSQWKQQDFGARFGLGYTAGASLSLSPQLYLDLRVTQNLWDNMRSLTARELSAGYFKVPSVQVSLGYRFRRFTPDN